MLCYITIAGLGVAGLLRRRWLIPAFLALMVYWSVKLPAHNPFAEAPPGLRLHIDTETQRLMTDATAARFATMFLAGALLYGFET